MKASDLFSIAKQSFQEWLEDRATNEAAALAYYTLLSVPAILLLIQWVLGQVVSDQIQQQVIDLIVESVRGSGSEAIVSLIENADQPGSGGLLATTISLVTLAVSATGVVGQLEAALNRMWEVVEQERGIVEKVKERAISLVMVLFLGFFLLVSVFVSTAVSGFASTIAEFLGIGEWALQATNILLSLIMLILLFGATLKIIPDAKVAWSDVWLGATLTGVLFVAGQYALSIYLGKSAPGSAYGAAGSIVAFVVWVYYSALILFLGAEFTQVYANRFGSKIRPDADAGTLEAYVEEEQAAPWREPAEPLPGPGGRPQTRTTGRRTPDSRPRPAPGAGGPVADARAYEASKREEDEGYFQYYTVALLALVVGIWRWLRGR